MDATGIGSPTWFSQKKREVLIEKHVGVFQNESYITGGYFDMGSTKGDSDEQPVHDVYVSDFYMSQYEITQSQWKEVMGYLPTLDRNAVGDNYPIHNITWNEAMDFCNKLSEKEGLEPVYKKREVLFLSLGWEEDFDANGYRLPTEAEWEYAAGGGSSNRTIYAGTNYTSRLQYYSVFADSSKGSIQPVGTKEPNSLDLYDMSGNVWEWCWDSYKAYSYSSENDPVVRGFNSKYVRRGGDFENSAYGSRVTFRSSFAPDSSSSDLGFRVVRR